MLASLKVSSLLDGVRGGPAVDRRPVARSIVALSHLAAELGDVLDALDINPLRCGAESCIALDALVLPRLPRPTMRKDATIPSPLS
jgi:hypothetical protein